MSIDLIDRIIYLNSKGENEPTERFNKWIKESEIEAIEFAIEDVKYCWKIISSAEFSDVIDEDFTDWFLIYSDKKEFIAIAQIRAGIENLIGENNEPYITTLWIVKSDIASINVNEKPILIWSPHQFTSTLNRIDYDFKQLLSKLKNPKIKLIEFVSYKISKSKTRRIR